MGTPIVITDGEVTLSQDGENYDMLISLTLEDGTELLYKYYGKPTASSML